MVKALETRTAELALGVVDTSVAKIATDEYSKNLLQAHLFRILLVPFIRIPN